MKRMLILAGAVVAGLSGCASPARYVSKDGDMGVVAIPNNSDVWPTHNRAEALALIEKHVGPNYEIIEEREVAVGQSETNNQQTNVEKTFNKSNPFLPAEKQTTSTTTTVRDVTEYRIAYRKRAGMPAQPGMVQTQYAPANGVGAQPAGGMQPAAGAVQPAGAAVPLGQPTGALPRSGSRMSIFDHTDGCKS